MESDRVRDDHDLTQHGLYHGHIMYTDHVQYGLVRYHTIIATAHPGTIVVRSMEAWYSIRHTDEYIIVTDHYSIVTIVFDAIIVRVSTIFVRRDLWYDIYGRHYDDTIHGSIL